VVGLVSYKGAVVYSLTVTPVNQAIDYIMSQPDGMKIP